MKQHVSDFVFSRVVDSALNVGAPTTVNVPNAFARFLVSQGVDSFQAEEEAERQERLLCRKLLDVEREWRGLGIPAPIGGSDADELWLTWRHPRFSEITGRESLSRKYVSLLNSLSKLGPRQYLLVGLLFLKMIHCDRIFVTDGSNDGGVDCIGRIAAGPLRSVMVFVQVKTRQHNSSRIGRDIVLQEFGKFSVLVKTKKYQEYLEALKFLETIDGSATVFCIMSNVEFDPRGRQLGRDLGVLLRSGRQMAHYLTQYTTTRGYRSMLRSVSVPRSPDLSTNFAEELRQYVKW